MSLLTRLTRPSRATHIALFALTMVALWLATFYAPSGDFAFHMTIGMGYWSLLLIAFTLTIGTANLMRQRRRSSRRSRLLRNPVNLDLRRDTGIWAGITGLLHVGYGLTIHSRGDLLTYWFRWDDGYVIRTDLFGWNNHTGLIATVILIALLLTSNMVALRRLKGPRWKALQRLNYLLFPLVLVHTFGYQTTSFREPTFVDGVLLLTLAVLAVQIIGIAMVRARQAAVAA